MSLRWMLMIDLLLMLLACAPGAPTIIPATPPAAVVAISTGQPTDTTTLITIPAWAASLTCLAAVTRPGALHLMDTDGGAKGARR